MANPIILYDSRFLDGTLSATDTASGYNVLNIKDYRTYTFWKAASAGTKYINVDCSPMVGRNFNFVQRLGSETQVRSLVSLGSGIVIAGTYPSGHIYRSTDNGQTWSFVQRLGSETQVWSLVSLGSGIVIAGTYPSGHIYRSAISADCIGIIGHNLKSADALVSVESSPNNINWSERLSPFLPPSDKAFLKLFSQSYDIYWRIKIVAASAVPYIAVAMLGNRLTFPYPPDAPYVPYVESIEAVTNQSKQGHLLGSVIGHKRIEISARFSNLQRSWVMSGFKSFWDNHASDLKPFFYAWDIDNFPDMVFYVRVTDGMKFRIPLSFLSYVDSIELEMEGVKE